MSVGNLFTFVLVKPDGYRPVCVRVGGDGERDWRFSLSLSPPVLSRIDWLHRLTCQVRTAISFHFYIFIALEDFQYTLVPAGKWKFSILSGLPGSHVLYGDRWQVCSVWHTLHLAVRLLQIKESEFFWTEFMKFLLISIFFLFCFFSLSLSLLSLARQVPPFLYYFFNHFDAGFHVVFFRLDGVFWLENLSWIRPPHTSHVDFYSSIWVCLCLCARALIEVDRFNRPSLILEAGWSRDDPLRVSISGRILIALEFIDRFLKTPVSEPRIWRLTIGAFSHPFFSFFLSLSISWRLWQILLNGPTVASRSIRLAWLIQDPFVVSRTLLPHTQTLTFHSRKGEGELK